MACRKRIVARRLRETFFNGLPLAMLLEDGEAATR